MSGHSKWSTIKRKKGAIDAARGRVFTKLIKEITVAARAGGGDPDSNPRLRTALLTARGQNLPADNIKKAIQRGTGELPGQAYEEIQYEGYGPGGVAILMQAVTDNRNRTVGELRHILSKNGGNLGETGSVGWIFTKQGLIEIEQSAASEDQVMEIALEAGADDVKTEDGVHSVNCSPQAFDAVKAAFDAKKIPIVSSEIAMVPSTQVKLEGKDAQHMLKLMESLEEHDDVQNVYANFDIEESVMEQFSAA
jgi:YebC/PmpR family DNA-binding regulatory protein